jgi:hypothetical protein
MNSYPPELLVQLAPVMFVAGLDVPPPPEPIPSSTSDPSLSHPAQDPFTLLTIRLRDALLSQRITAIWQPDKSKSFQTVLVDKVRPALLVMIHSPQIHKSRTFAFLHAKSRFLLQIQIVLYIPPSHRSPLPHPYILMASSRLSGCASTPPSSHRFSCFSFTYMSRLPITCHAPHSTHHTRIERRRSAGKTPRCLQTSRCAKSRQVIEA